MMKTTIAHFSLSDNMLCDVHNISSRKLDTSGKVTDSITSNLWLC